ncbi:MAG: ester cyclase [Spirochaetia bacterium]
MSLEENKTLAHKFHKEMLENARDDLIDKLISPDFVAHVPGLPDEFTHGPEGVKKWMAAYREGIEGIWDEHKDTIAEGDRVVVRFDGGGKHTGNMLGVPATGKEIRVTGIDIFRIKDGKIAELWQELDFLGMLRQMGAVPS